VLGDHVDEVVAELGEVGGGLPVVVPPVDDGRVERALEFRVRRGPDRVEEGSPGCAPDIPFVRRERIPAEKLRGFWIGPPDVAVEVVSADDRAGEMQAKSKSI
jgi:Uma2 family endonuclease